MPQTPVSANAFINSATPVTLYTAPAGKTAIISNIQLSSLLGSTFNITLNKVSASGVVYPIAVNRQSGDDVSFYTGSTIPNTSPMNALKGSMTLASNEAISISTTTTPAFKFPQMTTGNGQLNQVGYMNGRYVAVGRNGDTSRGLVLTSTDGQTWTSQSFGFTASLLDVAGNGSTRLIALSSTLGNGYYTSNDNGVTWTQENNLTGGHSTGAPVAIKFVNNLWIIVGSNYIYTSSNGTTWTINSALTTYLGSSSPALTNVTHDGTRYIFSCRNCAPIYSTDLVTFSNTGSLRFGTAPSSIAYYAAGNKFYATFATTTAADYLSTSTDGLNWSRVTGFSSHASGSDMRYVTAAGGTSQSIIMQSSNFVYGFQSTDGGTTWSSYDRNSTWSGGNYNMEPIVGLGNGYYLMYRTYNDGAGTTYSQSMVLSTNPATQATVSNNFSTYRYLSGIAVSNGVQGGPVVAFGYDYNMSYMFHTYTANPATGFSTSVNASAYSNYSQVGAVYGLGKYWLITAATGSQARVFSIDPASPNTLVYVAAVTTPYSASGAAFINGRLCIFCADPGSASVAPVVLTSTDGVNWATLPAQNAMKNASQDYGIGIFRTAYNSNIALAFNNNGQIISSTDGDNWYSIPQNFVNIASANGNIIAQNRPPSSSNPTRYFGAYRITNPTSVTGYTQVHRTYPSDSTTSLPNFVVYSNSNYFFTGGQAIGIMSNLSGTLTTGGVSNTAINGQTFISSPSNFYAIASSGSGMVVADARYGSASTWTIGYVPDITVARSVAAVSASILEIS